MRVIFLILATLLLCGCGDIYTEFAIREDGSATIRYRFQPRSATREDTSVKYTEVFRIMDSALTSLQERREILGFEREYDPEGRGSFEVDIHLKSYHQIDRIHRASYTLAHRYNVSESIGGMDEIRDSIVFDDFGDSIRMRILNWVPKKHYTDSDFAELGRGQVRAILKRLDGVAELRRSLGKSDRYDEINDLYSNATLEELIEMGKSHIRGLVLPQRHYTLSAPVMVSDMERFERSSLYAKQTLTEARWSTLHEMKKFAFRYFGVTPSATFSLRSPNTRSEWLSLLDWCDRCDRTGNDGVRSFINPMGVRYVIIDCDRSMKDPRSFILSTGYSKSSFYFMEELVDLKYHLEESVEKPTVSRTDLIPGVVTIDTNRWTMTIVHTGVRYSLRSTYDISGRKPEGKSIEMSSDNGPWRERGDDLGGVYREGRNFYCTRYWDY